VKFPRTESKSCAPSCAEGGAGTGLGVACCAWAPQHADKRIESKRAQRIVFLDVKVVAPRGVGAPYIRVTLPLVI
jgi:hypothetical protein